MSRLIFVLALVWAGVAAAQTPEGRLTVTGQGSVTHAPDMATINLGVAAEAPSAAEAVEETSVATSRVLSRLVEAGVAASDIQTDQLLLHPVYADRAVDGPARTPEIERFRAVNRLSVRVLDLQSLGGVLDAVVTDGANVFDGLRFGLQEPQPAEDAARVAAVEDAMRKARIIAGAAEQELGTIVSITENGGGGQPGPVMMEMARSVPVAEGEIDVSAQVTVVFALE
ncbi:SIMPL domain-containing protein [Tranquillimonas alkanivorans]|uniref:SIMPL domain-containing protein n=1 Tax=Tranquillimonas alkanivorans TaxID=441119 RepID=A0A1I5QWQ7_9RHOB|nr:SIMPL domain-containing protein [Tranquillimonas alkanivorans]SFP50537.1 hypothetical protein SAMN04488047_107146 [Tranquillimonas alkanivorans]